jgi:hypothetical protein
MHNCCTNARSEEFRKKIMARQSSGGVITLRQLCGLRRRMRWKFKIRTYTAIMLMLMLGVRGRSSWVSRKALAFWKELKENPSHEFT